MRKIFIDCGFNKGQSLDHFVNIVHDSDAYEIYCFEPDNRNFEHFEKYKDMKNVTFSKSAVWTYDGEIKFYLGSTSPGSTLIKEKTTANIRSDNFDIVFCIDLAKFIKQFNKEDYVILKLDIEGGEYKLLQHLIQEGATELLDDLFVEFHERKVRKSLSPNEHKDLVSNLKSMGFDMCETAWEEQFIRYDMLKISRDKK